MKQSQIEVVKKIVVMPRALAVLPEASLRSGLSMIDPVLSRAGHFKLETNINLAKNISQQPPTYLSLTAL